MLVYHNREQYGGSLKNWHRATIWSSNPTPRHISGENRNPRRYIHPSVHCGTIHNSQDVKNKDIKNKISKNKLTVTKGEMRGRDESEGWSEHTHTIAFKTDNQQGTLYSTVNSIWDSVIPYKEKNPKEWIYVYVELNHSAVRLKLTQYCKPTTHQ